MTATRITFDPKNYRELSEPFADPTACNEAIDAFHADVAAARKKHRIRDVLIVMNGAVTYPEREGEFLVMASLGNSLNVPTLAAYALGEARADQREMINVIVAGNGTTRGRR